MTLTFEYMTRETIGIYACRIWHTEDVAPNSIRPIARAAMKVLTDEDGATIEKAVSIIVGEVGVSAVEIVDGNGNGLCVYKDWP